MTEADSLSTLVASPTSFTSLGSFAKPLPPLCLFTQSRYTSLQRSEILSHLSTVALALDSLSLLSSQRPIPKYQKRKGLLKYFKRKSKPTFSTSFSGNEILAIWVIGMVYMAFIAWRLKSRRSAVVKLAMSTAIAGLVSKVIPDPRLDWLVQSLKVLLLCLQER